MKTEITRNRCAEYAMIVVTVASIAILPLRSSAQTGTVTLNSTAQTIVGFGASSAWSGTMSSAQASAMFGTLGFSLWRVRIDPGGNNSAEAGNASIAHSNGAKVLATPWTPPASMKSNNNTVGGSLNASSYGAYATYLNNSMSQIGADYVSLQNEPDANVTYESCSWTGAQFATFLDQQGGNIHYPIVMPESEGFNTSYSDPSLNDSTAVTHIAVIGGHLYGASPFTYTNALNHGKQVWMTEHYIGSGPDIGSAMTLAKEINDCMDNNMSAYLWWWAYYPGNATNLLNGSTILLTGYVMGQYAKFVRPGYVRVNTTYNPQGNVYLSAYTGSGKVVVVAVNTATSSVNQTISFSGGTVSSVTPYQTSSSQSMAQLSSIGVSNGAFTATLPAQSVTTFVGNLGSAGISNGNHTLTPQNATGSRLDANASGTSNGTKVQIWQASGGANQNWSFTNQGGSIYTVSPAYDTGLCLDVSGSGTANGTTVQLWGCWNGANQQWGAISDGGNIYEFAPQNAAGERLDVTGASSANGTQVEIWQSNGGSNQKWAVN